MWVPEWLPISFLDRETDNTYLVRVEGDGVGWIDKGYFADDEQLWTDDAGRKIERGLWKITAFCHWPELKDIEVSHASSCAVHNEPALPNGPCDCGAELKNTM